MNFCQHHHAPLSLAAGSDEEAIMAVLGARTNKQRQEIAAKFQQKYDKVHCSLLINC